MTRDPLLSPLGHRAGVAHRRAPARRAGRTPFAAATTAANPRAIVAETAEQKGAARERPQGRSRTPWRQSAKAQQAARGGDRRNPDRSRQAQRGPDRDRRSGPRTEDRIPGLGAAAADADRQRGGHSALAREPARRHRRGLRALQRMGRRPPPAVLVRPEDMLEAVRASILLGAVLPELRVGDRDPGDRPRRTRAAQERHSRPIAALGQRIGGADVGAGSTWPH